MKKGTHNVSLNHTESPCTLEGRKRCVSPFPPFLFPVPDEVVAALEVGARALAPSREPGLDELLPAEFIESHCAATAEGIRRMSDWGRKL